MTPPKRPRWSKHINDLPQELLERILDNLPLSDRKAASLVCRRWSLEAFSPHCLSELVKLMLISRRVDAEEYEVILLESCRRYRNILVVAQGFPECTTNDLRFLLTILSKFGTNVACFDTEHILYTPEQLQKILLKMPNLKRLSANIITDSSHVAEDDPEEFPVLRELTEWHSLGLGCIFDFEQLDLLRVAPKLNRLSVNASNCLDTQRARQTMKALGPQLKYLKLQANLSSVLSEKVDFRRLETLILDGRVGDNHEELLPRLLVGMPQLKTLHYDSNIKIPVLRIICQLCPDLRTFAMVTFDLQVDFFQCLESLNHLKVLEVCGFLNSGSLERCGPLVGVKSLIFHFYKSIPDTKVFLASLKRVFPVLESLTVKGTYCFPIENILVQHICETVCHLRELSIDTGGGAVSPNVDDNTTKVNSGPLKDRLRLQELTLKRLPLAVDLLPRCSLKRLKLHYVANLSVEIVRQIGKVFPQLCFLELIECGRVERKNIPAIRRMLPNCVLHIR
ncbi:uncharacterized protein LOC129716557 [Wyeomyia smithii]|uniref:uncharacterized protein LOC129716557 n=1 Tax=Wyeomyia smithii TaxID=174621 RepID=UPI002467DB63|nr:uncharacterized protein LOC129716557 [Wyeomyia smithii]XP_055522365.1 uncharacterized protein LOC129716557 [Wyeomyia smithii]